MTNEQMHKLAFPFPESSARGMSKLELFTAMALAGLCCKDSDLHTWGIKELDADIIGSKAIKIAEATLRQLP